MAIRVQDLSDEELEKLRTMALVHASLHAPRG